MELCIWALYRSCSRGRDDHPPLSGVGDSDGNSAFRFYTPFQAVDRAGSLNHRNDDFQGELMAHQEDNWDDRFENFQRVRIGSAFHGTFEGHQMYRKRNLPPPHKTFGLRFQTTR